MGGTSFPLVRGRTMRATKLNGCGVPLAGDGSAISVTDGYVSVALTANINEPEELVVTNANGQTCVRDPGCAEFKGYNVDVVFCNVDPCLYSLMTGQDTINDAEGNPIGFRMNSKKKACDNAFSLEVWAGSPGAEGCQGQTTESGSFGYLVLPFLRAGVVGDFTIENAAVSFTISGAVTLDGNSWGMGPYNTMEVGGVPAKLPEALDTNDHLAVLFTTMAPPEPTDGMCLTDVEYTAFLADGTLPVAA